MSHSPWRLQDSPFCKISRCSQRISPTKSGASSRKHSLPRAQRAAPFMQNFWKSTPFRLNSFTAHITQSRTCVSVHCWGSATRGCRRDPLMSNHKPFPQENRTQTVLQLHCTYTASSHRDWQSIGIRVKRGGGTLHLQFGSALLQTYFIQGTSFGFLWDS